MKNKDYYEPSAKNLRVCALQVMRMPQQRLMYQLGWNHGASGHVAFNFSGDALTAAERRDYREGYENGVFFVSTVRPPHALQMPYDIGPASFESEE